MARWMVTISGKGIRKAGVEKLAEKLRDEYGEGAFVAVTDASPPESRADRFSAAQGQVSEAKGELESLRDELQEWFDNLPQNFQDGDKGQELQTAIDALEEAAQALEEAEGPTCPSRRCTNPEVTNGRRSRG